MALLNREKLLQKDKLRIERVDLPDGDHVFVREMTGRLRDRWESSITKEVKNAQGRVIDYERSHEDFRAKLLVFTICDEEGNLLLKPQDAAKISASMSAGKMERIVNKAQKVNAISQEDRENLVKNSSGAQSDNSTSDSVSS
jgi:hypothetical protein